MDGGDAVSPVAQLVPCSTWAPSTDSGIHSGDQAPMSYRALVLGVPGSNPFISPCFSHGIFAAWFECDLNVEG